MKMPNNKSEDVFDINSTERWQHCVENTLRKTIIGLAVSSAALLLFREYHPSIHPPTTTPDRNNNNNTII